MYTYQITVFALLFVFGAVIGSFLNVLIYRFGSGMKVTGRSKCLSCGKQLTALQLVPVVSYLVLGGRCGHCRAKISAQYPLVEVTLGVMFMVIASKNALLAMDVSFAHIMLAGIDALVWSLLLAVTVYDWKHKIIPDRFSVAFATLAALSLFLRLHYGMTSVPYLPFLNYEHGVPWWIDIAAPLVALPFALIWLVSGGRAMGLGDAKLAFGIGWFLGLAGSVTALILSFWIAVFPSLALLLLRRKHFTMKSEIPFAPFIVMGAFVTYAWSLNILSWSL